MPYITNRQLARLRTIARDATMQSASFGFQQERFTASLESFGPMVEMTPDEFIKERTRIWRNSWLVEPLETIIAEIERKSNA